MRKAALGKGELMKGRKRRELPPRLVIRVTGLISGGALVGGQLV